jgi:hypothetical protein
VAAASNGEQRTAVDGTRWPSNRCTSGRWSSSSIGPCGKRLAYLRAKRFKTKFEVRDGKPVIARRAELSFIDDKAGKPAAIPRHIGRRPAIVAGNSEGDLPMLQRTAAGRGPDSVSPSMKDDWNRAFPFDK